MGPPRNCPRGASEVAEDCCFEDIAAVIGFYFPRTVVSGPAFRDRLEQLVRDSDMLSRLRQKYGWHDASKILPSHAVYHLDIESAALVFVGTRGRQVGWLASQADMLADDWVIVE